MNDGFEHPHTGFRAPRVPFDLRCILLAGAGVLATDLFGWLLDWMFDTPMVLARTLSSIPGALGIAGPGGLGLPWWQFAIVVLGLAAIWGLFGGAVLRTSALRLTRDDPISIGEGFAQGRGIWRALVTVPLVVAAFATFFVLCNMLAGFIMSLPGIGSSLLALVLFPLVLVASLLITLTVLAGAVGLPLMWAGAAVERNGALDAATRAYSYIFARPFRFLFGYLLLIVLVVVVVGMSGHFETTVKRTLRAGIIRTELDNVISKSPGSVTTLADPYENNSRTRRQRDGIRNIANIGEARWFDKLGFFWMWLLLGIFLLAFKGYAVYVILGGTVSLYLQLRREVDGAAETEIDPPLEEEADLFSHGPEAARWVGTEAQAPPQDEAPGDAQEPPEAKSDAGQTAGADQQADTERGKDDAGEGKTSADAQDADGDKNAS